MMRAAALALGILAVLCVATSAAHALRVLDLIYFTRGSDVLRKDTLPIIDAVAQTMNSLPELKRVAVIGHASIDDDPIEMERFNISVARSRAVIDALQARGVDRGRLVLLAAGSDKPLDTGKTAIARAKNRRVEFLILERENR